jgi:hypothetical protein
VTGLPFILNVHALKQNALKSIDSKKMRLDQNVKNCDGKYFDRSNSGRSYISYGTRRRSNSIYKCPANVQV